MVSDGIVTSVRSTPLLGTRVTDPKAPECTTAGLAFSPQVARISTEKPWRMVVGLRLRIDAAAAGAAPKPAKGAATASTARTRRNGGRGRGRNGTPSSSIRPL